MEKNITFESLMDGEKHPIFFVNGSSVKLYMAVLKKTRQCVHYNPISSPSIALELYDKNGKNKILGWVGYKISYIPLEKANSTSCRYFDNSAYKNYTIFTTKDEAYRHCVKKLMDEKRKINKKILKLQEEFDVIEKKPRFSKVPYTNKVEFKIEK